MAANYYDDILIAKIQKWIPEQSNLRVLKPDESTRLFELTAEDNKDQEFKLPLIALSRNTEIELLSTVKTSKSFDGLILRTESGEHIGGEKNTLQMNVLPIALNYQLDIYTKTYEEGDELLRNFLFKLINNPKLIIQIPYNSTNIEHVANIRVSSTISDTSSISERIFSGQFTRWTIQFEVLDAFLFSIPYRKNWKFIDDENGCELEVADKYTTNSEKEILGGRFVKQR